MTVNEEWTALEVALRDLSPDALTFLPPTSSADIERAESTTTGTWPEQLKQFYSLHNGQDSDSERYAGELLPASAFFTVDYLIDEYTQLVEYGQSELADDTWLQDLNAGSEAGATSHAYLPSYIPLCGLDGYYYFLDTRPGQHSGCIRHWTKHDGDNMQAPVYASIEDMLATVRHSVSTRSKLEGLWTPFVIDDPDWPAGRGALGWTTS